MKQVIIKDYTEKTIIEILNKTNNDNWKVLWIDFLGLKNTSLFSVEKIEEKINSSDEGYSLNKKELINFIENFEDITEFLIIGDNNLEKLYRYKDDKVMKQSCQFCFELVDSSFWEITTKEDVLS